MHLEPVDGSDVVVSKDALNDVDTDAGFSELLQETLAFGVEAAHEPDVWRAGTFETWTGRSWRFSEVSREDADPGGSQDLRVPRGPGDVVGNSAPFVQRVTVETDYAQLVVGAPVPTRVIAPKNSYVLSYAGVLYQRKDRRWNLSSLVYNFSSERPCRRILECFQELRDLRCAG